MNLWLTLIKWIYFSIPSNIELGRVEEKGKLRSNITLKILSIRGSLDYTGICWSVPIKSWIFSKDRRNLVCLGHNNFYRKWISVMSSSQKSETMKRNCLKCMLQPLRKSKNSKISNKGWKKKHCSLILLKIK